MRSRCSGLFLLAAAVANTFGQSSIVTILGGAPEGVSALSASLNNPSAVVSDKSGNTYIALTGARQVVKIDNTGIIRLIAGTGLAGSGGDGGPAKNAQLSNPTALAIDGLGNLYIADSQTNRIRKVSTDGTISTFAGNGKAAFSGDGGPATAASLKSPSALAFDLNGNLLIADSGNHEVRIVRADGTISAFAGSGTRSSGGDDGPATSAGLDTPSGVAVDATNNVYISDTYNQVIRVVSPDGTIELFAGKGGAAYRGDGGDALKAYFSYPTQLSFDSQGNLYILDYGNDRIRRINTATGIINGYAGTGVRDASGDGGIARSANIAAQGIFIDYKDNLLIADGTNNRLRVVTPTDGIIDTIAGVGLVAYNPRGILVDGNNVYFSDTNNHRVRRFNLLTGQIDLIAGNGYASFAGDGATALNASLNAPRGLAMDAQKNLYIADSANNRIRVITSDGNINTIAGDGTSATTGDGGLATVAQINNPYDIAIDTSGAVYIVERLGHVIRKATVGGSITTIAGTGVNDIPDSETGVALQQPLNYPQALAVEKSGSLLVADTNNSRVRRIQADGSISTVAGTADSDFYGDGGPAAAAALSAPTGLAVDAAGNIYITDTNNDAIRLITTDGNINTIAGTPGPGDRPSFTGDGSPATAYSLNRPNGVAVGPNSSILISDTNNQRVRRIFLGTK